MMIMWRGDSLQELHFKTRLIIMTITLYTLVELVVPLDFYSLCAFFTIRVAQNSGSLTKNWNASQQSCWKNLLCALHITYKWGCSYKKNILTLCISEKNLLSFAYQSQQIGWQFFHWSSWGNKWQFSTSGNRTHEDANNRLYHHPYNP